MVVIPSWGGGCNKFGMRGKGTGNSQSSHLASSAPRRIFLCSHTLLTAFPFQIGIIFSSHLPLVFLDAAVCLISYFHCHCLCVLLNLSLSKCCPFIPLPLLLAALPVVLRSVWQERRGVSLAGDGKALPGCIASQALLCWRSITAPPLPTSCILSCLLFRLLRLSFSLSSVNLFFLSMSLFPMSFCMHFLPSLPSSALSLGPFFPLLQYGWLCS